MATKTRTGAKSVIYRAVKKGKIIKPDICPTCDRSDFEIVSVIKDYSKPLEDLKWTCRSCLRSPPSRTGFSKAQRNRDWEQRSPERYRAHIAVRIALQKGILFRPDYCTTCGRKDVRIVGHHEDYSEPLEVIWMCDGCHNRHHWEELRKEQEDFERRARAATGDMMDNEGWPEQVLKENGYR